jgi:hypothetical protein
MEYITETDVETILKGVIDLFLIPRFEELGMNASGEWRDNLEVRGSSIWGRSYTEQLVYGRRPGTFAPIAPLIKWVEVKLGITGQEGIGVAWAINHKIKNEGTSYYQQGGTTLLEVLNEPETLDYIRDESMKVVKEKMIVDINRQLAKFKTI